MERSTSPAGPAPTRPVDAADAVGLTVLLLAGPGLLACAAALLQTGTSAPGAELTRVLGLGAGLAGLGLLALCVVVNWQVLGDLLVALFRGNLADVLIGVYLVGPLMLGIGVSILGLILESVVTAEPAPVASAST